MPLPSINPPLINSANPWATTIQDLRKLFECRYTGAITIRTSLLKGFDHDPEIHQHTFFRPTDHNSTEHGMIDGTVTDEYSSSLNTLGYSPIKLQEYLEFLPIITSEEHLLKHVGSDLSSKPIIVSVTGTAKEISECYRQIVSCQANLTQPLCMEINLSCPNILNKPPPAYSGPALNEYLEELSRVQLNAERRVAIGIKTPPYTYHDQFKTLITSLLAAAKPNCPIDFITATNTLGCSLLLSDTSGTPALHSAAGTGIGGLAGASLHPLALGNVKTLRALLDEHEALKDIDIIGVGGVSDHASFNRMQSVGAKIVGVATALGREGVAVFEKITCGK